MAPSHEIVVDISSDEEDNVLCKCKELDDDCFILDGDPDKPLEVANDKENGSDELRIVAEKGQLACRDYPHPRHLCARYPFITNLHEHHCDLCYCYVCDTPAPWNYWGTGVSSADHCHSTDMEEKWRIQRKCIKKVVDLLPRLLRQQHQSRITSNGTPAPSTLSKTLRTRRKHFKKIKQIEKMFLKIQSPRHNPCSPSHETIPAPRSHLFGFPGL